MDDHSNLHRGANLTKPFIPNAYGHGAINYPNQPQPRMSYNAAYSANNKEGPAYK